MNIISTWLCLDDVGDESQYSQVGSKSSSKVFQEVYWKCVFDFFVYNKRFNPDYKFVLFINKKIDSMVINRVDIIKSITDLGVEIVVVDFTYRLPKGYYGKWRNQLFEFNILESVVKMFKDDDLFLLLDSDCLIMKNLDPLFKIASEKKCITYIIDYSELHTINGITRCDMKSIYEELLCKKIDAAPPYHAGEFLMATKSFIKNITDSFPELFDIMVKKFNSGESLRFNEEAHFLSYMYFINGISGGEANLFIKRMWNSHVLYNIEPEDKELSIFHLPSAKKTGFNDLFKNFSRYKNLDECRYKNIINNKFLRKKNFVAYFVERLFAKIVFMIKSNLG